MTDNLDSESRMQHDDRHALKLWLRLLTCTNLVEARLREKLREYFDSTLPRFDLLAQLDRHPEKLRMGELTNLMMVSGGTVTGLVSQLEKERLVKRTPMKTDRRTFLVGLTRKGKAYFDKTAVSHEGWIIEMFSGMSDTQQDELMRDLYALRESVTQPARES